MTCCCSLSQKVFFSLLHSTQPRSTAADPSMVSSIAHCPVTPIAGKFNRDATPSNRRAVPPLTCRDFSKRCRSHRIDASLLGKKSGQNKDNPPGGNNGSIGLHLEDSLPEDAIKDSPVIRKPLSSSQLSKVSPGSLLRVAYQGFKGAYSELAAEKAYPNCEAVPFEQFDNVFEAVERWLVDRAVLPLENTLGGSIHRNYDLLLRHQLHIVGEVKLPVRHCLLANPGVMIEDLKRVVSHPQALAQCEHTLTKLGLVREAVDDTAGAAQYVSLNKLKDTCAVASSNAASIYGLNILAKDIQDGSLNLTRFMMLARDPIIPGVDKPFKTSIVFALEEGPGMLFKALAVFALRNINLSKIESRPLKSHPVRLSDDNIVSQIPFDYLFYVDFAASMADQNAQNALRHLNEVATYLRVLGSYPLDPSFGSG